MSVATHRKLILAAIICLLLYQVGIWITLVAGAVWGAGSAVVVAVVSYLCARLARRGVSSSVWFLMPTLLFTVIPLAAKLWGALSSQAGMVDMLIDLLPLLVGFVVPIVLLSIVYLQLRKQAF
ncbi:hypothetical protein SAMN05192566_2296 [Methylophilus rhizosphaerae]|uniref:Uncharacterized protein n=1 Tax=Methylophilus rhizosphaerae TaxID=492660 RepID=A0A1G9EC65_9PROT|nr:hypothetical protein [Methylophilus rhizosphaerae]SDK73739.1 hypothetical protein SAMN05192566_2296 [Methylophilus rhizosphaerae]